VLKSACRASRRRLLAPPTSPTPRRYADYKFNGKKIDQQDFGIIFATYSRTGEGAGLADVAFAAADTQNTGSLPFEEFIKFLKIMIKGDSEEKMRFCFSLFDVGRKGYLDRKTVTQLLARLPLNSRKRKVTNDGLLDEDADAMTRYTGLGSVYEEDENADAVAQYEAQEKARVEAAKGGADEPAANAFAATLARTRDPRRRGSAAPSAAQLKIAEEIVDEAYEDLQKNDSEELTVDVSVARLLVCWFARVRGRGKRGMMQPASHWFGSSAVPD